MIDEGLVAGGADEMQRQVEIYEEKQGGIGNTLGTFLTIGLVIAVMCHFVIS